MTNIALINHFKEGVGKNTSLVEENFSHLSQNQFNFRTSPEKWSIGQCIQHINMTGLHYLKQFEKLMKHGLKSAGGSDYSPGFLGSYIVKIITPVVTRKFKTLRMFQPHYMVMGKACIEEFFDIQKRFSGFADKFSEYDLEKNKINSIVTPLVKLKIGDAFQINNQHTLRHINQALQVKNSAGFPSH